MPSEGEGKCLAFVQTYDQKPKRRLFELLRNQHMQMNQQITFLTDGGEDIRDLPQFINPEAEHILDCLPGLRPRNCMKMIQSFAQFAQ
jgi:hypothetical protein